VAKGWCRMTLRVVQEVVQYVVQAILQACAMLGLKDMVQVEQRWGKEWFIV